MNGHDSATTGATAGPRDGEALAAIALAFCRECRGWEDARCVDDYGYPYIAAPATKERDSTRIPPYERHFHYMQVDRVLEAVHAWLETIDPIPAPLARRLAAALSGALARYLAGKEEQRDLSYELLAACVQARRRAGGDRPDA